jgi:hypothetical protein
MKLTAGLLLALLSTAALNYGFYLQHAASGALPALTLRPRRIAACAVHQPEMGRGFRHWHLRVGAIHHRWEQSCSPAVDRQTMTTAVHPANASSARHAPPSSRTNSVLSPATFLRELATSERLLSRV